MSGEFPKIVVPNNPLWREFFVAQYVHERERLEMPRDLLVPDCPICLKRKVSRQEGTEEAKYTPPQLRSLSQSSESLEEVPE